MSKILVFVYDTMADFEMSPAVPLVGMYSGREVIPIAYTMQPAKGSSGLLFSPRATVAEALEYTDVDGLIIPGGQPIELRPELIQLIQRLDRDGKLIAAICAAPQYLARAGVLAGRKYTTTLKQWTDQERQVFGFDDPFPREGFTGGRVETDGNIVTALGLAFIDFGVTICDWFRLFDDEAGRKRYIDMVCGMKTC